MSGQLSTRADALRLFFTEDIYLVPEPDFADTVSAKVPDTVAQKTEVDDLPAAHHPGSAPRYKTFEALGKNQKNILILVNDADNKVSTEKGSELLRNLIKAIGLTASDFALVNYAAYPNASYSQLSSFFSSTLVFCFGVSLSDLQMDDLPLNEISEVNNVRVIPCANLELLAEDQPSKKTLWGNLKKLNL